ncbi:hypothetical protein [Nesterenkonia pannonica]|uniref:DUF7134 domain-containing protein n=1 Tax=Nesterenkonia pannonica TaxID=1548602 RepID=UPI0021643A64|nr:hypothetical protein [Nesterenkonia pannonica]
MTWGRNRPEFGMLGADVSWPLMLVLDLIAIGALVISRIRPGTALAAAGTACTLQILLLQGPGWASLAVPAVVYACAKYGSRRISLLSLWWGLLGHSSRERSWSAHTWCCGPAMSSGPWCRNQGPRHGNALRRDDRDPAHGLLRLRRRGRMDPRRPGRTTTPRAGGDQ